MGRWVDPGGVRATDHRQPSSTILLPTFVVLSPKMKKNCWGNESANLKKPLLMGVFAPDTLWWCHRHNVTKTLKEEIGLVVANTSSPGVQGVAPTKRPISQLLTIPRMLWDNLDQSPRLWWLSHGFWVYTPYLVTSVLGASK